MNSIDQQHLEPAPESKPTRLLLRPAGMREFVIYATAASLNHRALLRHDGRLYVFRGEDQIGPHGWVRVYAEAQVVDVG